MAAKPKVKKKAQAKPRPRAKLNPAQRRRRQLDRTLYNPARPLGGRDLRRAVGSLVTGEIRPQVQEINRQIQTGRAQTNALSQRAGDHFTRLAGEEQRAIDTTRALSSRLNTGLAGVASGASAATTQAEDAARARLAQDAATRGQGLDGGAAERIATETAAQRAVQASTAQAFQSAGQMQGAGYEGMAAMARAASASRAADLQGQLATRQQANEADLRSKRQQLVAQKGPLRTKLLMQLRQAGFEQLATQLGLDLKAEDLQAEIELARMRDATTRRGQNVAAQTQRRGQNVTMRGQDLTFESGRLNRQAAWERALLTAEEKGSKESQSAKNLKLGIDKTLRRAIELTNTKFKGADSADELEAAIRRHMGRGKAQTEPLLVDAAMEIFRGEGLSGSSAQTLRDAGVEIPRRWTRAYMRRKPKPRKR